MKVYVDTGATTKVDQKVLEKMMPYFTEQYGNASSIHEYGQIARRAVEQAREVIAKSINSRLEEIVFTSGGTESNNFAIKGTAFANRDKGNHIIISKIEHDCVLNAAKWLKTQGFEITYLNVDKQGSIDFEQLKKAITPRTTLVSIIHGNNEIGTVQDLGKIGKLCRGRGVLFHTDACQSYTKSPIDVQKMNVDLVTINAHKIYGPKGVGALYVRKGVKITPLLHGGGHENGYRAGTENVHGIVGFAEAVKIANEKDVKHMKKLQNYLINGLLKIEGTRLNGPRKKRLCNNVNVTFESLEGESILMRLDDEGVMVSTGSACSSHTLEPSHVLKAIGLPHKIIHGSIRFTINRDATEEQLDYVIEKTGKVVEDLRKISPLTRR